MDVPQFLGRIPQAMAWDDFTDMYGNPIGDEVLRKLIRDEGEL
jgi:hypothetical protein